MEHQHAVAPILEELDAWLRELVDVRGSDLHIKVGSPPRIRDHRFLRKLDRAPITFAEATALADALIPSDRRVKFQEAGEVDFAHGVSGLGRFRVNAFRQRGSVSLVMRRLQVGGADFSTLGLPPVVRQLAAEPRGLVIVAGPTGSGKTTTLAAMIEHINRTMPVHIVTIEDPVEILHPDQEASVNQREVGLDTESFHSAIRAAMRQDPDVILIGEMRDQETVQAAVRAAETGHLVLSTLHTVDAAETINRIVQFFPADQQGQVRLSLAGALRGIVCQRLVTSVDGARVPAIEVLVNTGRVAERIIDPTQTSEISEVIAHGGYYGMQTFDQSLLALVTEGRVSVDDALDAASESHDFQLMLQQAGIVRAGAAV